MGHQLFKNIDKYRDTQLIREYIVIKKLIEEKNKLTEENNDKSSFSDQ